ncbi:MAG: hypothetical protein WBM70_05860 [Sulfurovum sp.]|uniref:hypothetical protein n=1 Tax=Sulfurovum sp. TaxID=1969726 RepID=UPI003C735149
MLRKYIKLIVVSTVFLQAAPQAFSSLGDELEAFQEDCRSFQKISMISAEIQKECNRFHLQANNAFKIGYKLDPSVEQENVNEKALNRYLSLLRHLDKRKEKILGYIYLETRKARKENNFSYYGELIENHKVKLYDSDYEFIGKHKKVFSKNTRYIANSKYIQELEEERLKKEKANKKRRKKNILQSELPIGLMDHVSPKAFNSLGNELEAFREDCQKFQKISKIPVAIQESCNKYSLQLNKAFDVGYKLDPSVEKENVNEKEAYQYLSMLRHIDKRKEKILNKIYLEARKARKENNFGYYGELTENYKVKLYGSDYEYMEKYKKVFSKNARYIEHTKHLQDLEEERLKKEKSKRGSYKKSGKIKSYRVNY